jgi:hypothetical protein
LCTAKQSVTIEIKSNRLREGEMITIPELAAEALGSHLAEELDRRFA